MRRSLKKSPGSATFDIYITSALDKGEMTVIWLADCQLMGIFYAAYHNLYNCRKTIGKTGSRTKAFAFNMANTPEWLQMKKRSNVAEKGDKNF